MREQRSLAGSWQFQLDPEGGLTVDSLAPDREIPVPLPWQVAFPDLQQYSGYAWYRRALELDATALAGEVLLHFGAVDYWCQVYINGQLAGEHEGGYTPFTLPIRRYVHPGANEIAVRVYDSVQSEIRTPRWPDYTPAPDQPGPPFPATDVPHGKQEWYINVGGIWQDVTCTAVPAAYVSLVHVTPDIHAGQATIAVEVAGALAQAAGGTLLIQVQAEGRTVGTATLAVDPQVSTYQTAIPIPQPRMWEPDDPYLYTATARLQTVAGDDTLETRFGMREIRTQDGQVLLNGTPLYLLAALDQDLYPDTIYTVPSEAFLRDEFQKAKALGLNCLRCHIKPPDPRYLDLADEMGLLIWAEIPSWRTFWEKGTRDAGQLALPDAIKARVRGTLAEMICRDYNHPALIIWTIVNEDWGTSLPLSAADRAWVAEMYSTCKALDPTRLVVDNSPCPHSWGPNIHVHSDLDDFHIYANIPDQAVNFEQTMDQFNLRPLWTYSSHGDVQRTGQEPLILSEFGNWGLPSLEGLRRHYGGDPPWFDSGPWWSGWEGEAGWPSGVAERFQALGLDRIWPDYEAFVTATQWHQFAALKFQIEALRRQPALAGYVITEFTDAYWESNGLLDFVRQPKAYYDRFAGINAPDVVLPWVERYAYWSDQQVGVELSGAHYGPTDWNGAHLQWTLGAAHGARALGAVPRGTVRNWGWQRLAVPDVPAPQIIPLEVTLRGPNAAILSRNQLDLLILPAGQRAPGYTEELAVVCGGRREDIPLEEPTFPPDTPVEASQENAETAPAVGAPFIPPLDWALRSLGYQTGARLGADTHLAVTNYPTAELLQWVRAGGDLLFLCQGPSPFFWAQARGGAYSGSWLTSFSWLRPAIHRRLQVLNPLGLPFMHPMPPLTILGLPVEDPSVQQDILAGMISGWVGHPAVHTVQFRYGRGRVVMTTFALEHALADSPVAVAMLHDLIDYLHSEQCQPTLTAY